MLIVSSNNFTAICSNVLNAFLMAFISLLCSFDFISMDLDHTETFFRFYFIVVFTVAVLPLDLVLFEEATSRYNDSGQLNFHLDYRDMSLLNDCATMIVSVIAFRNFLSVGVATLVVLVPDDLTCGDTFDFEALFQAVSVYTSSVLYTCVKRCVVKVETRGNFGSLYLISESGLTIILVTVV